MQIRTLFFVNSVKRAENPVNTRGVGSFYVFMILK